MANAIEEKIIKSDSCVVVVMNFLPQKSVGSQPHKTIFLSRQNKLECWSVKSFFWLFWCLRAGWGDTRLLSCKCCTHRSNSLGTNALAYFFSNLRDKERLRAIWGYTQVDSWLSRKHYANLKTLAWSKHFNQFSKRQRKTVSIDVLHKGSLLSFLPTLNQPKKGQTL